jgi:hypothetical protein
MNSTNLKQELNRNEQEEFMSSVTVYQNDKQVFHANILDQFHIEAIPTGELIWYEVTEIEQNATRQVWIQKIGFDPKVAFLCPDWQLVIDGVWMEKKFYPEVEYLKDKKVELRYKEYRFVFQFV